MKTFPIALQQELLDLLESEKSNDLIKASKMKQGRMIVSLKTIEQDYGEYINITFTA